MIKFVEELRLLGVEFDGSDEKIRLKCPYHEDNTPSCSVDLKTGWFKCRTSGCNITGDFTLLLSRFRKEKPADTRKYIAQKYGVNLEKTISPLLVEECHVALWDQKNLLQELADRAVTPALVTQYRLGFQNGRITIPITNSAGFYIDLRSYSPGAERNKFTSMKGYGGNYLFPHNQLDYDKIVLVGGEIKAIACAGVLNPLGYGVVTNTTGEGNLDINWVPLFQDKSIYIIMDIDSAGRAAAKKVCHILSSVAKSIYDITLDMDVEKYPKGGPDDFIASGGNLAQVLRDSEPWQPTETLVDDLPKIVKLPQAFSATESGNRLQFVGVIDCLGEDIYHIPKDVKIICDKKQPECMLCPKVYPSKDSTFRMHPESAFVIETAGCSKASQVFAVRDALSIPQSCHAWTHQVNTRYSVEDVRISSELDIHHRESEREMQPALIVRESDEEGESEVLSNETYEFVGRTWPSPKNQAAVSVISGYKLIESALESYRCEDPERLQVFQPLEWTVESIREKLDHIYEDLEANVTHIFQRREIHLAIDLCYHSPLFFDFDRHRQNGWVSCLIMGDTSQGKSYVPKNIMSHYKLGTIVEAGSTTAAGILGGIDKLNGSHFVTWGVLAQQDKRLVFIDELNESKDSDLLGRMNDTRSSGLIRLNKIKKATARARTRTIMAANPKNGRSMSSYNYGVDAVVDLIGHPQYIRRFDLAVVVQKDEVDGVALQTYRPTVPHIYTSTLCNELVLWAWTVREVVFEDEKYVLNAAVTLTKQYSEDIPLVDKGSMRLKLARLAAAVAARTYSEQNGTLLVRNCHVQFVVEFLNKLYSKQAFGYLDYSKAKVNRDTLRNKEILLKRVNQLRYPREFVEGIREVNTIDVTAIMDLIESDRSEAQSLLSCLLRHRAIRRAGRAYYKTGEFTKELRHWASNGCLEDKPEHIKERYDTL